MKNTTTIRKKAALYDPYLDTLGGGENHILSILKVLEEHDYDIVIYWDENLTRDIQDKLNLTFSHLKFEKNIFLHENIYSRMQEMRTVDMFFYVTDGSYFFSSAKKNFVFCMVPQQDLYRMTALNQLKTANFQFIANSEFTRSWLSRWGINASVIYPYLSQEYVNESSSKKQKIILSVGRFFRQLHAKRQDIAIKWFQKLQQNDEYKDYELHLAGSVKDEDKTYFQELQKMAEHNKQIQFHPNISFSKLNSLYDKAEFYWHFAGFEVDEKTTPEKTEHLGITPLEAMAKKCITYAYRAGGPKEIIKDGKTGFLFSSMEELFDKMKISQAKKEQIIREARSFVREHFTYTHFKKRVENIIIT